jgi:hypothetical protein
MCHGKGKTGKKQRRKRIPFNFRLCVESVHRIDVSYCSFNACIFAVSQEITGGTSASGGVEPGQLHILYTTMNPPSPTVPLIATTYKFMDQIALEFVKVISGIIQALREIDRLPCDGRIVNSS